MNLAALNSLTKYPSIPTYHEMGERGVLSDKVIVDFGDQKVYATEKIDGTNARIIALCGDWYIGSREELLTACGDRIVNPALGIVEAIRSVAPACIDWTVANNFAAAVFYTEVFGGKTSSANKIYSKTGAVSFRLFDVQAFNGDLWHVQLEKTPEQIARWRDSGYGTFLHVNSLANAAAFIRATLVPSVGTFDTFSGDHAKVLETLRTLAPKTQVALDGEGGRAEGLVLRTADRSKIAKIRFEDYERTLRAGAKK